MPKNGQKEANWKAKIEEKIGVADAMKGENAEVLQLSGIYLSVEQVEESMT